MAANGQVSINVSTAGDTILIPAIAGQAISVISLIVSLETETTIQFKSGNTPFSGPQQILAMVLDELSGGPRYITAKGEAFVISLGSAVQCGGTVWYRQGVS